MSDVPQTPGGFPGPFDLNKIMRMLQSPGPVNMEVARETAETMANVDVETGHLVYAAAPKKFFTNG